MFRLFEWPSEKDLALYEDVIAGPVPFMGYPERGDGMALFSEILFFWLISGAGKSACTEKETSVFGKRS
ncbi:hypothetical protein [Bacillus smithii]|uniref:hypothetical protein n=1 Tax=Bacillus smithii TaxID=1479 RepID=UPI0030C998E6